MLKRISISLVLPVVLAFFAGCGGSSHHTTQNEVPVVVSISDQPPNVGVLSFDLQITGACLLTSADATATTCSGAANLFPANQGTIPVQLSDLQTSQQSDVLATTTVAPGTYSAVLLTFGTATAAVNVDPGTTDTDTATPPNSCTAAATPTVCQLSPTLTPSSVNVPFTNPVVFTAGQPESVSLDFNVASSLIEATAGATNTFTIDPSVTASASSTAGSDGNLFDANNVTGTVTAVHTNSFTITDSVTNQPVTLALATGSTPTAFNGFTNCTANNLTCIQVGQIVTTNFGISDTNPLVQTASSITDNGGFQQAQAFEGTIVETGATPMVLVTGVLAGNTQGVSVGQTLTLVPPTTSAGFSVAVPAGQTLPGNVSFAGPGDFVVGQNVLIDSTGITTAGNVSTTTADEIALEPTQFSGTVSSITSPNVTVNGLNNFFVDNNIQNINFETGTQTTFGGTVATTGFNGITVGDQTDMSGFLFNGGVGQSPVVFGETILDNGVVPAQGMKTTR